MTNPDHLRKQVGRKEGLNILAQIWMLTAPNENVEVASANLIDCECLPTIAVFWQVERLKTIYLEKL